eukprot:scaffold374_cov94-Skeletonema_dohrnii-CCMP3373.AAC.3
MATSASPASPPSPSRALHSGVSVLDHLGDAEMNNNNENTIGTAGIMDESMNNDIMSSSSATTNDDIDDAALPESPPSDAVNQNSLGGSIATPAYALLVGAALENESKIYPFRSLHCRPRLTEYNSNDGDKTEGGSTATNKSGPKLSKSMCCILLSRWGAGRQVGSEKKRKKKPAAAAVKVDEMNIEGDVDALNGMNYLPYEKPQEENDKAAEVSPNDIRLPSIQQTDPLPSSGFFAVVCTGRKIIVGGTVLKKGQHAMLSDGITVQIASHCFYFLLPKNVDAANSQKSIKVTLTKTVVKVLDVGTTQSSKKKRDNDNDNSDDDTTSDDDSSILMESPRPTKKSKSSSSTTTDNNDLPFVSTLESKTDTELLQMISEATESTDVINTVKTLGRYWPHVPVVPLLIRQNCRK